MFPSITYRPPKPDDCSHLSYLITQCSTKNLSFTDKGFLKSEASTSAIAMHRSEIIGFLEGQLAPNHPDTLLIKGLVVAEDFRRKGIATQLIKSLFSRQACYQVRHIEVVLAAEDKVSQTLFKKLADTLKADFSVSPLENNKQNHEIAVRISVFNPVFPTISAQLSNFLPACPML